MSQTAELAHFLDIVDIALATISRRLPATVARDDLASAGKLALVVAVAQCVGTPDEVRAYCFVSVRGAMVDELHRLGPLSRRHRALAAQVARILVALQARVGRLPTAIAKLQSRLRSRWRTSQRFAWLRRRRPRIRSWCFWRPRASDGSVGPLGTRSPSFQ